VFCEILINLQQKVYYTTLIAYECEQEQNNFDNESNVMAVKNFLDLRDQC
jgi:hypothetical protein